MAYKSLLTIATSPLGLLTTVTAAAQIANRMDAHLDGLALGVDQTQVGFSYVGSGAVVIAAAMERAEEEAREVEAALNAAIVAQPPTLRSSVEAVVTVRSVISAEVSISHNPRPAVDSRLRLSSVDASALTMSSASPGFTSRASSGYVVEASSASPCSASPGFVVIVNVAPASSSALARPRT